MPGAANTATIGVNFAITNQPTIGLSGASTINVGAVIIGNKGGKAVNLTVNPTYTLAIAGDITKQSDASSSTSNMTTLIGGGTITATNVNVLANIATAPSAFTESLTSSDNLTLSGNIVLTSTNGSYASNAAFIIAAGTTSLTGTGTTGVIMTNNKSGSTSTLGMTGGILQFVNGTLLSGLSATGTNTVFFNGWYN